MLRADSETEVMAPAALRMSGPGTGGNARHHCILTPRASLELSSHVVSGHCLLPDSGGTEGKTGKQRTETRHLKRVLVSTLLCCPDLLCNLKVTCQPKRACPWLSPILHERRCSRQSRELALRMQTPQPRFALHP